MGTIVGDKLKIDTNKTVNLNLLDSIKSDVNTLNSKIDENKNNILSLNSAVLTVFDTIVAIVSLVIILAALYYTSQNRKFSRDAERELNKMIEIYNEITSTKEKLTSEINTAIDKEIKKIKQNMEISFTESLDKTRKKIDEFNDNLFLSNGLPIDFVNQGYDELSKNNYEKSEIFFKQAIYKTESDVSAWIGLSLTYIELCEYRNAFNSILFALKYDSVTNIDADSQGAISLIKAKILKKWGRVDKAIDVLESEVLIKNPNYTEAINELAECENYILNL